MIIKTQRLGSVVPLTMFQIYLGKSFDISHVRFDVIFVLQRVGGNSWHGESPLEIVRGRQLSVDRSGLLRNIRECTILLATVIL